MKQSDRKLAESNSEDERIRKSLIRNYTNQHSSNFPTADGFTREQILAWLEKQGEKKSTDNLTQQEAMDIAVAKCFNEQKAVDKVEPKFNVGDWCIDNEDGTIFQIVKVLDNTYTYKTNEGKEYSCTHYSLENDARLWTIADAKCGDVLVASDESLFIFARAKGDAAYYHFSLCKNGSQEISDGKYAWEVAKDCYPATQKQRNLLFQKMKESGYEWNADKKELNTIESKFNASDWVVNKNGTVQQILSYKNGIYKHTNGYSSKMFEDEWRLWDITKDAKDGDVLATDDGNICIFDGTFKDGKYPFAYCGLTRHRFEFYDRRLPFTHNNIYPATKEQYDTLMKAMADAGYTFDFDKKELKTIESKFKVGDWIVFNGLILLVNEVVQGYYRTISIGGIRNSYDWDIDNMARLWTLQEAKDGDVLTVEDRPFIYNGEVNPLSVGGYCGIDINNIFKINEERLGYGSQGWTMFDGDIYPATKEQRELLFRKMKKSGYTFNFEKKELKKIPNALEECEIEHVEHGKYYYCIKDYYSGGCKRASKGEVVKALRGMSMMALGAEANKYFIPVKRIVDVKHAWSEEDEDMIQALNVCIDAVIKSGMNYISFDSKSILIGKIKNWLRTLKDRV